MINQIFNDDCVQAMKKLPDKSIDCVITDPPYGIGLMTKSRGYNLYSMRPNSFVTADWDNSADEDWHDLMSSVFEIFAQKVKIGGNIVVFSSLLKIGELYKIGKQFGLYYKTAGIWHKPNPMPRNMNLHFVSSNESWVHFTNQKRTGTFNNNGKMLTDYFESSAPSLKERMGFKHPSQKPLAVIRPMIEILTNKGDTVLDCFIGSGTTAVAAIMTERNYIGYETDKNYFEMAKSRIREVMQ